MKVSTSTGYKPGPETYKRKTLNSLSGKIQFSCSISSMKLDGQVLSEKSPPFLDGRGHSRKVKKENRFL